MSVKGSALPVVSYLGAVVLVMTAISLLPITRASQHAVVADIRHAGGSGSGVTLHRDGGFGRALLTDIQRAVPDAAVCPSPERRVQVRVGERVIDAVLVGLDIVGDPRLRDGVRVGPDRLEALQRPTVLFGPHVPGLGTIRAGDVVDVWTADRRAVCQVSSLTLPLSISAAAAEPVIAMDIARFLDTMAGTTGLDRLDIVPLTAGHAYLQTGERAALDLPSLDPTDATRRVETGSVVELSWWLSIWERVGHVLNGLGTVIGVWVLALATVGAFRRNDRRIRRARESGSSRLRALGLPLLEIAVIGLIGATLGGLHAKLMGGLLVGVGLPLWTGDAFAVPVALQVADGSVVWGFGFGVLAPLAWCAVTWHDDRGRERVLMVPEAEPAMGGVLLVLAALLMQPGFDVVSSYLLFVAASLAVIAGGLLAKPAFVLLAGLVRRVTQRRCQLEGRVLALQLVAPGGHVGVSFALLLFTFGTLVAAWLVVGELAGRQQAWFAVAEGVGASDLGRALVARATDVASTATRVQTVSLAILVLMTSLGVGPAYAADSELSWRGLAAWGISRRRLARAAWRGQVVLSALAIALGGVAGAIGAALVLGALRVPAVGGWLGVGSVATVVGFGLLAWVIVTGVAAAVLIGSGAREPVSEEVWS